MYPEIVYKKAGWSFYGPSGFFVRRKLLFCGHETHIDRAPAKP